ncbi:MAG TPA: hypothetical protein VHJ78_02270, partial [Actinomycetota bacterium]|nr:hypothetical protein [Actinomycetota bacterium]
SGSSKVINTGAADAVVATSNPGHALALTSGGLDIDTTGGRGLEASGGGSISVQGTGNTITTTTGTPLNITNVTITPNVTFQSISANGATQGIVLSGVGSAGSMSVTGTGPSGSGGTIQNIANRGASFINARNITLSDMNFTNANQNDGATPDGLPGSNGDENGAVHLDAAVNVALTDIAITTTAQHGINGVGVRNLDLTNVTINDAGNETPAANGNLESGVYLTNLTGLASASQDNVFSNLNVSNTGSFNVYVANGTPTSAGGEKDKLTMTGGTFNTAGQNVLSDNVTVDNFNSANFQTVVTNSSFTAGTTCGGGTSTCSPDNIQVNGNNTSKFDVSISGSTFTQAGQSAINVSGSGSAVGSFSIANNPNLTVRAAQGINIASNGSSDLSGTIAGNTISTNVNNNPGVGIDMVVDAAGGSIVANVSNNTIAGSGANIFEYGIRGGARNGNGTADITLNNNTVQAADGAGVWIFAGNNTGQGSDTCVNFVSNQIDGNGANAFTDYFLDNYAGSTFSVQGFASGTIQDYVASTDDDPSPNDPTVTINSSSSPFTNATCATP